MTATTRESPPPVAAVPHDNTIHKNQSADLRKTLLWRASESMDVAGRLYLAQFERNQTKEARWKN
jgi:hypothetical protein